jgi:hypothetical protein
MRMKLRFMSFSWSGPELVRPSWAAGGGTGVRRVDRSGVDGAVL